MKKKFKFFKDQDISTKHINFFEIKNYSVRDKVRDYYDVLIRRPIYDLIYRNFFKNQNYI